MEVVSVNANNKEVMRYRIISCSQELDDVREILLFPDGMVGTLGGDTHPTLCCSLLITQFTPPHDTTRLEVACGKFKML